MGESGMKGVGTGSVLHNFKVVDVKVFYYVCCKIHMQIWPSTKSELHESESTAVSQDHQVAFHFH